MLHLYVFPERNSSGGITYRVNQGDLNQNWNFDEPDEDTVREYLREMVTKEHVVIFFPLQEPETTEAEPPSEPDGPSEENWSWSIEETDPYRQNWTLLINGDIYRFEAIYHSPEDQRSFNTYWTINAHSTVAADEEHLTPDMRQNMRNAIVTVENLPFYCRTDRTTIQREIARTIAINISDAEPPPRETPTLPQWTLQGAGEYHLELLHEGSYYHFHINTRNNYWEISNWERDTHYNLSVRNEVQEAVREINRLAALNPEMTRHELQVQIQASLNAALSF